MNETFWKTCAKFGFVVVPCEVFSTYRDGNFHDDDFIGIKYGVIDGDTDVSMNPDDICYIQIDGAITDRMLLFDTPEIAVEKELERMKCFHDIFGEGSDDLIIFNGENWVRKYNPIRYTNGKFIPKKDADPSLYYYDEHNILRATCKKGS